MTLGGTVAELQARMSSAEFTRWMAYYTLEPFGPLREDLRAGWGAAMSGNAWGAKLRPEDFFPNLKTPLHEKKPQSVEEMKAAAIAITLAMGGTVK